MDLIVVAASPLLPRFRPLERTHRMRSYDNAADAAYHAKRKRPDLVLVDRTSFDDIDDLLDSFEAPVAVTGQLSAAEAATFARRCPVLPAPFGFQRLLDFLEQVSFENQVSRPAPERPATRGLTGMSELVEKVRRRIKLVARTRGTVLITGETGTGKSLAAEQIHQASGDAGRFVSVNCAALPEALLESELFGHTKGAFTGAVRDHDGLAKVADGGTLFLDEIDQLTPALQAKLLSFIETRRFRPVGSSLETEANCRIVCATNADLTASGFRQDLYWRISVVTIEMPPLRELPALDVRAIAIELYRDAVQRLGAAPRLEYQSLEALSAHPWPGNVRELRNAVERAIMLAEGDAVIEPVPH